MREDSFDRRRYAGNAGNITAISTIDRAGMRAAIRTVDNVYAPAP